MITCKDCNEFIRCESTYDPMDCEKFSRRVKNEMPAMQKQNDIDRD